MAQRSFVKLKPLPPNLSDVEIQIFLSKDYVSKPVDELKERPAEERITISSSLIIKLAGTADPILQRAKEVMEEAYGELIAANPSNPELERVRQLIEEAKSKLRATNPFGHAPKIPQASPVGATADRINAFPKNVVVGGKKKMTRRLKKKSRRRV